MDVYNYTSSFAMSGSNQYILKARTRDGFGLKVIAEYLSNQIKFPTFQVTDKGITLRATDQPREILVDWVCEKENFTVLKCPKPLFFQVNSSHFYRLVKAIKKKDSITLFINESSPMQLGIRVEQAEDTAEKITTYINITYVSPEVITLPDEYGNPRIITSKPFQKLKTLQAIGNEMKITVGSVGCIKFFVNGKNLFSREVSIGEDTDDEDQVDNHQNTQTYTTSHLTQLTKCAGQSANISIYHHEELPLWIKMRALGVLSVYIKSKELIEQLEDDQDGSDDDIDDGDNEPENNDDSENVKETPESGDVDNESENDESDGENGDNESDSNDNETEGQA